MRVFIKKLFQPFLFLGTCITGVLGDSGGLFRGDLRHANFVGIALVRKFILFFPRPVLISLLSKCKEQTFVKFVGVKSFPTFLPIFRSHCDRRYGSFGKLNNPTLFP